METTLSQRDRDYIVHQLRLALQKDLRQMVSDLRGPEFVNTREAADILRITPRRMRQIADRYPHIKQGDGRQARLLFDRSKLIIS